VGIAVISFFAVEPIYMAEMATIHPTISICPVGLLKKRISQMKDRLG